MNREGDVWSRTATSYIKAYGLFLHITNTNPSESDLNYRYLGFPPPLTLAGQNPTVPTLLVQPYPNRGELTLYIPLINLSMITLGSVSGI